jgi:2,3-bisphosphoglycerate-dependent phosphoglycerate mutase
MAAYLVRHGESIANKNLVLSGVYDHPLTDTGRAQARQAGLKLNGTPITQVFSSVLCRAIETAEIILAQANIVPVSWIRDARLNERDFGIYGDVAQSWIAEHHGADVLNRVHTDIGFRMERAK